MTARVVLLPGDGVGPEVVDAARVVLDAVARRHDIAFQFDERAIGGAALRRTGAALPRETLEACLAADAVLLGAVGDPAFDEAPRERKPETALLELRKALDVYANLRPARMRPGLEEICPLRPERAAQTDLFVVRELTGGLYFGAPRGFDEDRQAAVNTLRYSVAEIERVAEVAFRIARTRRQRVTSVDKANVLETSQLWREVVTRVATAWPDVRLDHMYVDACAMFIAAEPARFDVILTENLFGDILSDEAGAIVGSLGLLPSASLGRGAGLYEPVHGSAPTLAGRDVANPIGAIASAAMMLRYSLDAPAAADAIERAIDAALAAGLRTADLAGGAGTTCVSCRAMAAAVAERAAADAAGPPHPHSNPLPVQGRGGPEEGA